MPRKKKTEPSTSKYIIRYNDGESEVITEYEALQFSGSGIVQITDINGKIKLYNTLIIRKIEPKKDDTGGLIQVLPKDVLNIEEEKKKTERLNKLKEFVH